MAILLLGGNLDDLVEFVTDMEWGEARLKFCCFSIKLIEPGVEKKEVEKKSWRKYCPPVSVREARGLTSLSV
jgi:hypothetical protein